MVVAGIYIKSSKVRIVTLSGSRTHHHRVAEKFHQLVVADGSDQAQLRAFRDAVTSHLTACGVDAIAIDQRAETGQRAGSGSSFRIEGALLVAAAQPVTLVHSATIAATNRRHNALKTCRPDTADLGTAYDLAFQLLPE